jgi:hypothetical protein
MKRRANMGVMRHVVDGNQTLVEQERMLNFMEKTTSSKVIRYAKTIDSIGIGIKSNEALLEDMPVGEQPGKLELQVLGAKPDFSPSLQKGRIVVFHDFAYVAGVLQIVFGFRQ